MVRPLSNDLRERAVRAVESGESCHAVAARFARCGVVRCEVAPTLSCDRFGGAGQDGRAPQADSGATSGIHRGADQPDATSDAARSEGRTRRTRREGLAPRGVDVPATRGSELQKKHCSPLSRAAPTSRGGGSAGIAYRIASIQAGWCSSTRPGSRPTWPRCAAGGPRVSGCAALRRMATGER